MTRADGDDECSSVASSRASVASTSASNEPACAECSQPAANYVLRLASATETRHVWYCHRHFLDVFRDCQMQDVSWRPADAD